MKFNLNITNIMKSLLTLIVFIFCINVNANHLNKNCEIKIETEDVNLEIPYLIKDNCFGSIKYKGKNGQVVECEVSEVAKSSLDCSEIFKKNISELEQNGFEIINIKEQYVK